MSAMDISKHCWQHMRDASFKQVGCAFHPHSISAAGPLNWVVTYNIGDDMLQHPSCREMVQYTEVWIVNCHICIQDVGIYIELLVAITGTLIVWTAVAKLHVLAGPAT